MKLRQMKRATLRQFADDLLLRKLIARVMVRMVEERCEEVVRRIIYAVYVEPQMLIASLLKAAIEDMEQQVPGSSATL